MELDDVLCHSCKGPRYTQGELIYWYDYRPERTRWMQNYFAGDIWGPGPSENCAKCDGRPEDCDTPGAKKLIADRHRREEEMEGA